jgi:hypothetical protein
MSYNSYTIENIFDDPRANAVCDYLFDSLQTAFPAQPEDPDNEWVFQSCILSGKAAATLRGDAGTIANITFQVDRDLIYNWMVQNLGQNVFKCNQISFKNRILLYPFPDLYFEFWWSESSLVPMSAGLIYFQNIDDIPPLTL